MFDNVLIMAGGAGTRLWPASSSRLPKQFLPAGPGVSFFDMAIERGLSCLKEKGKLIIIAGSTHIPHVIKCTSKLKPIDKKKIICLGEPAAKNTAPAIACALKLSQLINESGNMLVLTSDHIIKPLKTFVKDASIAAKITQKKEPGGLVVFGIPPTRADTGYGYIEISSENNIKKGLDGIFTVENFHEKPDAKTAEKYVKDNRFFWNSGMFAFNVDFLLEQFSTLSCAVISPYEKLKAPKKNDFISKNGVKILKTWKGLEKAYKDTQSISFDYAIVEKCKSNFMVKTNFNWIDIGDWEEYAKIQKIDKLNIFEVESSCHVDSDIPVALVGVEDLIVVIRSGKDGQPASALITKKGQTQKVKDAVELIKKSGRKELL